MSVSGNLSSSDLGNQARSARSTSISLNSESGLALRLSEMGTSGTFLTGVWCRTGQDDFGYNDGDSVENRILEAVEKVSDLSSLSEGLHSFIQDWPTLYHFSTMRANVVRPFKERLADASVLEIGSGCGAITRYLGETMRGPGFGRLTPSCTHYSGTHTRLGQRGGYLENFQDLVMDGRKFDVVTLIGVFEYSQVYIKHEDPFGTVLEMARSLLKPDGCLIIAIENQLGLKYFAGAPEDHVGVPFYGIEDRYTHQSAKTFGAKELRGLLRLGRIRV